MKQPVASKNKVFGVSRVSLYNLKKILVISMYRCFTFLNYLKQIQILALYFQNKYLKRFN